MRMITAWRVSDVPLDSVILPCERDAECGEDKRCEPSGYCDWIPLGVFE